MLVLTSDPRGLNPDTGRRAKGSFERLVRKTGRSRNELTKARKFARLYRSARERKWILDLGRKEGKPLTKSHICRLVVVDDPNQRSRLATRCAKEAWSVRRLGIEVAQLQSKRSYGGRRLTCPASKIEALAETEQLAQRWIRWSEALDSAHEHRSGKLSRPMRKRQQAITTEMEGLIEHIRRQLARRRLAAGKAKGRSRTKGSRKRVELKRKLRAARARS
jgi:hypothetical protein